MLTGWIQRLSILFLLQVIFLCSSTHPPTPSDLFSPSQASQPNHNVGSAAPLLTYGKPQSSPGVPSPGPASFSPKQIAPSQSCLDNPLKSRAADPYVWIPASLWPHFGTAAKPHPRSKDISLLHYSVLADTIIRHHTIEGEFSRNLALWHAPDLPRLWQLLAPNDDSLCGWTKEGLFSRYCPVLVEKSQGGPLGRWMHLLCGNRAAYRRGLLIQSFGVE